MVAVPAPPGCALVQKRRVVDIACEEERRRPESLRRRVFSGTSVTGGLCLGVALCVLLFAAAAPAAGQGGDGRRTNSRTKGHNHQQFAIQAADATDTPGESSKHISGQRDARDEQLLAIEGGSHGTDANLDTLAIGTTSSPASSQSRAARHDANHGDNTAAREHLDETRGSPLPMHDVSGAETAGACDECRRWFATEPDPAAWFATLPACPCALSDAAPPEWHPINVPNLGKYYPTADRCILSGPHEGHGQMCCYTRAGGLITTGLGAGRAHFTASPTVNPTTSAQHFLSDTMHYIQCCETCRSDDCRVCHDTFMVKRPASQGSGCPETPSPMIMPSCEPRDHACFSHEGKTYIQAQGACEPATTAPSERHCIVPSEAHCAGKCMSAFTSDLGLGCFCAHEVSESDVNCVSREPLLRGQEKH